MPFSPENASSAFNTVNATFPDKSDPGTVVFGALYNLNTFLARLQQLIDTLTPAKIVPVFPTGPAAPPVSVPPPPDLIPVAYTPPAPPLPFSKTLSITELFPAFDATPPNLIFPISPTPPSDPVPASPPVDLNFVYPDLNLNLPAPPDLLSIKDVQFDGVTFPVIDATLPQLTAVVPSITPYIQGLPYTDALLTVLKADLQDRIINGTDTGLPAAIETNLWARARERELLDLSNAVVDLDRMESMGFAFPPGAFIDARTKLQTEFGYKSAGISRDVAIKQAELHLANVHKALELTVGIEGQILQYQSAYEQRTFEAAKYQTEAGIEIYRAQVQAYQIVVQAYQYRIQIYAEQIKLALAEVEVFKTRIEAEKIKADIDTALVNQFQILTQAALAAVEVYKTQIQAIQVKAGVEKLKVEIFGEQVKAFLAGVNVYTAQVEGYKAAVSAEGVKQQVFKDQVDAFAAQVSAVATQIKSRVEIFQTELAAKTQEYDGYKALIAGQSEQVRAISAQNEAIARIYEAVVKGTAAFDEVLVKEWEAVVQQALQVTQIGVKAAEANASLYLQTKQIAVEAAKAGATVEAQIAASDIGRVTFSTSRSVSGSLSAQDSESTSDSFSTSTSTVRQINSVE